MNKLKSIYQQCVDAGVEIDHWNSDLYVPVTNKTREILKDVSKSIFIHAQHKTPWFDVPFMYEPYWKAKGLN